MRCVSFLFSSDFPPYLAGSYLRHRSSGVYVITATIIPLIIKNTCNIWRPQLFRTNLQEIENIFTECLDISDPLPNKTKYSKTLSKVR